QCPPAFVNHFSSHRVRRFHVDSLASAQFLQRDRAQSTPAFNRHRATLLVGHKIFQSPKQKRTKSSFFLAEGTKFSTLQELRKKTLRNILCLFRRMTLSPQKGKNRP